MVIRIGSNISSLEAQRHLGENCEQLSKTSERLSSGLRINRASDDAAGLAIAKALNTDSRVYTQAMRNVNDGLSYLNIAAGALSELSNITSRQLELAQQAANGCYSFAQRKAITAEANALTKEFNRIVQSTAFNGRKIIDVQNSEAELRLQAGYGQEGGVAFDIGTELSRSVGTGEFSGAVTYTSGIANFFVQSMTSGDVDGDGDADIVTAAYDSGGAKAGVWINEGSGNFSTASAYTSEGIMSFDVVLGDLDGDGDLDIATAGYDDDSNMTTLLFNDGRGNFSGAASYTSAGYGTEALALGDIYGVRNVKIPMAIVKPDCGRAGRPPSH